MVLVGLARDLGCGPRRAALVALAYGLATPAYVVRDDELRPPGVVLRAARVVRPALAARGAAAVARAWPGRVPRGVRGGDRACRSGLVSAVLGLYLLAQVVAGRRKPSTVGDFAVGAAGADAAPAGLQPARVRVALGHGLLPPHDHAVRRVHSEANPLGLRRPGPALALALLWGRYRGLLFYAPVVALVPFGLVALAARRAWGVAVVSSAAMAAVFAVNLSYPEWTGGWSTGPRLLVPLLPFAMLPVAGLLARGGTWATARRPCSAVAGGVLMLLFVGVGGRLPQDIRRPARAGRLAALAGRGRAGLGRAVRPEPRRPGRAGAGRAAARRVRGGSSSPRWSWRRRSRSRRCRGRSRPGQASGQTWVLISSRTTVVSTRRPRIQRAEPQRVDPDPPPGLVPGGGVDQADRRRPAGGRTSRCGCAGEEDLTPAPPASGRSGRRRAADGGRRRPGRSAVGSSSSSASRPGLRGVVDRQDVQQAGDGRVHRADLDELAEPAGAAR